MGKHIGGPRTGLNDLARVAEGLFRVVYHGVAVQGSSVLRHSSLAAQSLKTKGPEASIDVTNEAATTVPAPQWKPKPGSIPPPPQKKERVLHERRVPASSIERAVGFGGMAIGMAFGAAGDMIRNQNGKLELSEANAERLAAGLCRMRGAALKLGQMMSLLDEASLSKNVQKVISRVRDSADAMPKKQLHKVLVTELGTDWREKLGSFDATPVAAASIGQVHKATTLDGSLVAMKIQYPGVSNSIESDLMNVTRLLKIANVFPKGLYLDKIVQVAKEELAIECNYTAEAEFQRQFGRLLEHEPFVHVPRVVDELSTSQILTTEFVDGYHLGDRTDEYDQDTRHHIAEILIRLCLKELFELRFMQTDPNWSNYLYNEETGMLNLIDFGATKQYDKKFVDEYLRMVYACAHHDRDAVIASSIKLGLLTGEESKRMLESHVESAFIVGEPFASDEPYDFAAANLPARLRSLAALMLRDRLTPPPIEVYSLHRKLSGAFLTCIRLKAVIPCRQTFLDVYKQYSFDE